MTTGFSWRIFYSLALSRTISTMLISAIRWIAFRVRKLIITIRTGHLRPSSPLPDPRAGRTMGFPTPKNGTTLSYLGSVRNSHSHTLGTRAGSSAPWSSPYRFLLSGKNWPNRWIVVQPVKKPLSSCSSARLWRCGEELVTMPIWVMRGPSSSL